MRRGGSSSAEQVKVRKDFPETWIWREIQTNQSETFLGGIVPDTLTSWLISGYSLHPDSDIGILQQPLTLKTFRHFFLTMNKPYSVVKGEIFGLQILVHNYLDKNVTASVTLQNPERAFEFYPEGSASGSQSLTETVLVVANDIVGVTMLIRPIKFGPMKLDVSVSCAVAVDAVSQILIVKPPGQKQEGNEAVLLDLREKSKVHEMLRAHFPPQRVEGTDMVKISIISDILGSTITNLDKLLRMPTGCGEQNMVHFVPDIVIMDYLKAVGKLSPEIKEKATQFLEIGYQRQLTYRHSDGSFSSFGKSDAHGSSWLTAFVVRSFIAASAHITIDHAVIQNSLKFLASKQETDGRFLDHGRLLNLDMAGGATDSYSLSAYILLAFVEYDQHCSNFQNLTSDFHSVLTKGLGYISQRSPETLGPYPLTLVTFALQAVNHHRKVSFHKQLEKLATSDGTFTFWEPRNDTVRSTAGWEPKTKPISVEMTAYSLLMYIKDYSTSKALSTGKWLLRQRNSKGGFISTQDTVVGLTALGKFALTVQSVETDLRIRAGQEDFLVNGDNAFVLQEVNLPNSTRSLTLEASGNGTAVAQLSWSYFVENKSESPVMFIEVQAKRFLVNDRLHLKICMAYKSDDEKLAESNMVVCEINLHSGYEFEKEDISGMEGVKRTELEDGATRLNVYFEYLNSVQRCIEVQAVHVFEVTDPAPAYVSVYDYYEPGRFAREFYSLPAIPS